MGYSVTMGDSYAILPTENQPEAYRRLCDLNKQHDLKGGGSWVGDAQVQRWFRWMPSNYDEICLNTKEILETVGFQTENGNEGLEVNYYEQKTGDEDLFIATIADLFLPDSYMEWRGEDGAMYRWDFGGGKPMMESSANIVWSEPRFYESRR
jgi:hypothetical protein